MTNYSVRQVVGIDTSKLFIARTGIRGIKRSGLGWTRSELRSEIVLTFSQLSFTTH